MTRQRQMLSLEDLKERRELPVTFKTLDGEEHSYVFIALTRKDAMEVHIKALQTVMGTVISFVMAAEENQTEAVTASLEMVDPDKLWYLAGKLFKDATVDGQLLGDLDECDYFTDRIDEYFLALVHAIRENYPNFFTQIEKKVGGFSLVLEKMGLSRGE